MRCLFCGRTASCHKQACELVSQFCIGQLAACLFKALPAGKQEVLHLPPVCCMLHALLGSCNAQLLRLCMSTALPHTACCKTVMPQLPLH